MKIFEKAFDSLMNKITMLIGRGIVKYIDNAQGTQRIRLGILAGEILNEIERLEDYGFTSYPHEGSEAAAVFMGGRRQHGIILKVHDRRYRPQDLSEGESCIYSSQDSSGSGHRIHLKDDRSIEIIADGIDVLADSDKIEQISGSHEITSSDSTETTTTKIINATTVQINASSIRLGGAGAKALLDETAVALFNSHTHDENGSTTDPPNQSLSIGSNCTSITKAL